MLAVIINLFKLLTCPMVAVLLSFCEFNLAKVASQQKIIVLQSVTDFRCDIWLIGKAHQDKACFVKEITHG